MKCREKRDTTLYILHSITLSPLQYISCSFAENRLPLGQCVITVLPYLMFSMLLPSSIRGMLLDLGLAGLLTVNNNELINKNVR